MTRGEIGALNPAYFALVMATGVVSIILHSSGWPQASNVLLGVSVAALVVLLAMAGWSLVQHRATLTAIAGDPRRAFAFFTFVAAWNVLSIRLSMQGLGLWAFVFLMIGGAAWLVLTYAIPIALIIRRDKEPVRPGANGTWFTWVVGIQTVVVASASLPAPMSLRLAPLAVICWSLGVVLYMVITAVVLTVLLHFPLQPTEFTPPYWVLMGGTAISVVAGLQTLRLRPDTLVAASSPVIAGTSVVLWGFGTWLIPLLLLLGGWKHLVRRIRPSYEPALWSMIFVIGMYGLASHGLGALLRLPWMIGLGVVFEWITIVLWVVTFVAMLWSLARGSRPARDHSA
jgi:tellurite resistance protein TehA-like permease